MKKNEIAKASENLTEVSVQDATITKSCKKGGKKESANEEPKRTKSDIFGELRSLFELDLVAYSEKLQTLCTDFVNGKISALEFDKHRADIKKGCIPSEVESIQEFENRKGVAKLLDEILNLYGIKPNLDIDNICYYSKYSELYAIFLVDEGSGIFATGESAPSIKVYSKDQNESGNLIAENNLYFRLESLSASTIIAGIAGAGVFLNSVRVEANKKANNRKQSLRAIDELLKREVIDATKAEELKKLVS